MRITRSLIHLVPIAPSRTGNGLAMRCSLFLAAASHDFDVQVVVVPVAGGVDAVQTDRPGATTVIASSAGERRSEVGLLLADPVWRRRIGDTYPLPALARLAPPTLAGDILDRLRPRPATPVHVARSYLSPLGVALAERIGSPWMSLDLDDDDEALVRSLGDPGEADGYGRLVGTFGPLFGAVGLAAPAEAAAVCTRHGFPTHTIPNAVRPPARSARRPVRPRRAVSLLFVGNLSYQPNVDAAYRLVEEVLPRLRATLEEPVRLTLAGDPGPDGAVRALGTRPDVRVTGFVPDLEPLYADADVAVVPLSAGGGTRIKLLEAFAHGLPVVSTSVGAAGLDVSEGVHLLIADSVEDTARQVARVATDRRLAMRLGAAAERLARGSYSYETIIPRVREFFGSASAG